MKFVNVAAATLVLASYLSPASAAEGYVTTGRDPGIPVRTRDGQCVHTRQWHPDLRFADCEPVAAPTVEAPMPRSAPQPEPEVVEAPAPAPKRLPVNVSFSFSADAFFAFDKSRLRPEGRAALDDLAKRLSVAEYDRVTITGHADRIGASEYNQRLSELRANAMRDYLVQNGVPAEKINAIGRGNKYSVAKCPNLRGPRFIACLQPDRSAQLIVSGTVQVSAAAGN